jgi:hypothetical protein
MRPKKCLLPGAAEIMRSQCALEDWPSYRETTRRVQTLVVEGDLDLVLRAEKDLGFSKRKFTTGEYYLEAWYSALEDTLTSPHAKIYQLVEGWTRARGDQGYAKIAQALFAYGEAWGARGGGGASTVSPEGWSIYRRKLKEADKVLDSAPAQTKELAPWYALKLTIAYQDSDLMSARKGLLAKGTDLWPDYVPLYSIAMAYSLPRWGGTYQEVDRIAHLAYEKSKPREGASLYPMSYRLIFAVTCDCTIADTVVDWDLMKRGFRDIEKQGGASEEIWESYAKFACQMRDRPEARRLLELSDKMRKDRSTAPADPCREFAFQAT